MAEPGWQRSCEPGKVLGAIRLLPALELKLCFRLTDVQVRRKSLEIEMGERYRDSAKFQGCDSKFKVQNSEIVRIKWSLCLKLQLREAVVVIRQGSRYMGMSVTGARGGK